MNLKSHKLFSNNDQLTGHQISALSKLGVEIMSLYGTPQDIEWTYSNGEFQIVQSRPITSIKFKTEGE